MRDYVAQGEELVELLLPGDKQPRDTVLSLAISQASPKLVKRLINERADVHTKTMLFIQHGLLGLPDPVWDATPLHLGSFYSNAKEIQVLFDHRGNGIDIADMVSCRDNFGRLPLNFAAGGRLFCSKRTCY